MKCLVWLSLLTPMIALASEWDSPNFRLDTAKTTLNQLKKEIQDKGDESLRSMSGQVTLVVSEDVPDEPRSSINNNGRKIEISDMFIAKTANLARMTRLARDGADQACMYGYKAHMERTGSRLAPEAYLQSAPPECSPLKSRLPVGPMSEALAEREISATLAFTYLHELGHQFHNHQGGGIRMPPNVSTKENQCMFLSAMKLRRELEYEADDYAVDSMVALGKSHLILSIGTLWLLPPMIVDSSSVSLDQLFGERLAAHPNPGFRWVRILDRTADALSKQGPLNLQISQLILKLKEWREAAKGMVEDYEKAFPPC